MCMHMCMHTYTCMHTCMHAHATLHNTGIARINFAIAFICAPPWLPSCRIALGGPWAAHTTPHRHSSPAHARSPQLLGAPPAHPWRASPSAAADFWVFQFLIFFIIVNIFLAILNDAYIAVNEKFSLIPEEEREHITIKERIRRLKAAIRQRKMDQRIEQLRAVHRRREMTERRIERKREDDRMRVLKSMGQANAEAEARKKKGATTATRDASAAATGAAPGAAPATAPATAPAPEDATPVVSAPPQHGEGEVRSDDKGGHEAEQLL